MGVRHGQCPWRSLAQDLSNGKWETVPPPEFVSPVCPSSPNLPGEGPVPPTPRKLPEHPHSGRAGACSHYKADTPSSAPPAPDATLGRPGREVRTGHRPSPWLQGLPPARHQPLLPHYSAGCREGPQGEGLENGPRAPISSRPASHPRPLSLPRTPERLPSPSPAHSQGQGGPSLLRPGRGASGPAPSPQASGEGPGAWPRPSRWGCCRGPRCQTEMVSQQLRRGPGTPRPIHIAWSGLPGAESGCGYRAQIHRTRRLGLSAPPRGLRPAAGAAAGRGGCPWPRPAGACALAHRGAQTCPARFTGAALRGPPPVRCLHLTPQDKALPRETVTANGIRPPSDSPASGTCAFPG